MCQRLIRLGICILILLYAALEARAQPASVPAHAALATTIEYRITDSSVQVLAGTTGEQHFVDAIQLGRTLRTMVHHLDHVYVVQNCCTLWVLDRKDPRRPTVLKKLTVDKYIAGLELRGGRLVVRLKPDGGEQAFLNLQSIELEQVIPVAPPAETAEPAAVASAVECRIKDQVVQILVKNPKTNVLELVSTMRVADPLALLQDGDYLFIARGWKGLAVVDLRVPRNPVPVRILDTGGFAARLERRGGQLLIRGTEEAPLDVAVDLKRLTSEAPLDVAVDLKGLTLSQVKQLVIVNLNRNRRLAGAILIPTGVLLGVMTTAFLGCPQNQGPSGCYVTNWVVWPTASLASLISGVVLLATSGPRYVLAVTPTDQPARSGPHITALTVSPTLTGAGAGAAVEF